MNQKIYILYYINVHDTLYWHVLLTILCSSDFWTEEMKYISNIVHSIFSLNILYMNTISSLFYEINQEKDLSSLQEKDNPKARKNHPQILSSNGFKVALLDYYIHSLDHTQSPFSFHLILTLNAYLHHNLFNFSFIHFFHLLLLQPSQQMFNNSLKVMYK